MRAQGTITEQDYVASKFLHMRPRPVFAVVGAVLLLLVVVALMVSFSLVFLAVLLYLLGYFFLFIPWRARRIYREYKALASPVVVDVRDDGLFFQNEHGTALIPWGHVTKWRTSRSFVLVYPNRSMYYLFPRHFFSGPEEFQAFRGELEKRVGRAE